MARMLTLYGFTYIPTNLTLQINNVVLFQAADHAAARRIASEKLNGFPERAGVKVKGLWCGSPRTNDPDVLRHFLGRSLTEEDAARVFKQKRAISFNPRLDYTAYTPNPTATNNLAPATT